MQAVILAGGKGTRLRPLTLHTPKPIVPIANRPFLLYQIDLLKRVEIIQLILCLSYQPRKIEEMLGDGTSHGIHINYLMEPTPLGTAGALKNAESMVEGPLVVLNGDILTDVDLGEVIEFHRRKEAAATIVLTPVENPSAYGLVETGLDGQVRRFIEKPQPDQVCCNTINAGTYILEPSVLQYIPANQPFSFEYDLFPALLADHKPFYAFIANSYWLDIGTPARYLKANLDVMAGRLNTYKSNPGKTAEAFREFAEIDSVSLIDPGVTIKPGVRVMKSIIGSNCFLEDKAVIENSVIWAGSRISSQAIIRSAILGKSCHIGRSATVGDGVVLGDKSVITDFSQVAGEYRGR